MDRRVKSRMLWLQDSDTAFWIAPMEAVRKGQDAGLDNHPFCSFLVLFGQTAANPPFGYPALGSRVGVLGPRSDICACSIFNIIQTTHQSFCRSAASAWSS